MKLTSTLLPSLLAGIAVVSGAAAAGASPPKQPTADFRPSASPSVLVAEVDGLDEENAERKPYRQTLERFLDQDDFTGAKAYVERLDDVEVARRSGGRSSD
jgi:hypothetical protein